MRRFPALFAVLLAAAAAGCAQTASRGVAPRPAGDGPAMSADLVPFTASSVEFVQRPAARVGVRTEPTAGGAVLQIEGAGGGVRRIDLTRTPTGITFSGGPGWAVELVRVGAPPGATWSSGGQEVVFDGWERVETGGGLFDAARVRTTGGSDDLPVEEAWWFAPGVGLVRYRQDNAGIFSMEMVRAR